MQIKTRTDSSRSPKRVLAIASGGGHWVQLMRLRPALDDCDVTYVTVNEAYRTDVGGARFCVISDSTRWSKFGLVRTALQVLLTLLRERPDVVVSTGAAPGYFAVRFGKWFGAKTIWLDSIANVDQVSMAGAWAGRYADLFLTQWQHLAKPGGPSFVGAVV